VSSRKAADNSSPQAVQVINLKVSEETGHIQLSPRPGGHFVIDYSRLSFWQDVSHWKKTWDMEARLRLEEEGRDTRSSHIWISHHAK
jgi:hypothetical protein